MYIIPMYIYIMHVTRVGKTSNNTFSQAFLLSPILYLLLLVAGLRVSSKSAPSPLDIWSSTSASTRVESKPPSVQSLLPFCPILSAAVLFRCRCPYHMHGPNAGKPLPYEDLIKLTIVNLHAEEFHPSSYSIVAIVRARPTMSHELIFQFPLLGLFRQRAAWCFSARHSILRSHLYGNDGGNSQIFIY